MIVAGGAGWRSDIPTNPHFQNVLVCAGITSSPDILTRTSGIGKGQRGRGHWIGSDDRAGETVADDGGAAIGCGDPVGVI